MRTLPRNRLLAVATAMSLAFTAVQLSAQQPQPKPQPQPEQPQPQPQPEQPQPEQPQPAQPQQQPAQACTATAQAAPIAAGDAAVQLALTLSEPIGDVSGFQAGEDSALKLAAPEDLAKAPMAEQGEQDHKPIEMANEGNALTLWINTANAKAGTYDFTVIGSEGQCTGKVTVGSAGG